MFLYPYDLRRHVNTDYHRIIGGFLDKTKKNSSNWLNWFVFYSSRKFKAFFPEFFTNSVTSFSRLQSRVFPKLSNFVDIFSMLSIAAMLFWYCHIQFTSKPLFYRPFMFKSLLLVGSTREKFQSSFIFNRYTTLTFTCRRFSFRLKAANKRKLRVI